MLNVSSCCGPSRSPNSSSPQESYSTNMTTESTLPFASSSAMRPPPLTTSPTTFPRFSSLPVEIRSMIWEYSLPPAKVYEILDAPRAKHSTPSHLGLMFANTHNEPPPPLASACQESRYSVLRHYKPLSLANATKYIDLSRDILLLEPYLLVKRLLRALRFLGEMDGVREHIAHIALGTSYGQHAGICHPVLSWKVSKANMARLLARLARFPKLRKILFVVHQEFQFDFDWRYPNNQAPLASYMGATSESYGAAPSHPKLLRGSLHSHSPGNYPSLIRAHQLQPSFPPPLTVAQATAASHPSSSPSSSSSYSPSPPPQTQTGPLGVSGQPHSQLVHQAYRFKFDIEANINHHHPRHPHNNELLFYPLPIDEDREEDYSHYYNINNPGSSTASSTTLPSGNALSCGGGLGNLAAGPGGLYDPECEADEEAWCDQWPTNDDWRRFKRRFARAMHYAAAMADNERVAMEMVAFPGFQLPVTKGKKVGKASSGERGVRPAVLPTLDGVSLLWRYSH